MAERTYLAASGPMSPTSPLPKISTGTSTKTLLQVQAALFGPSLRIVEWGCSFDGTTPNTPIQVELIETGGVGATVTAYKLPNTTVATAISSSGTTTLVVTSDANFPSSGNYLIKVGTVSGTVERMLVTGGQGSTSWTVVRGIDSAGGLASIPVGSQVWGEAGPLQWDIVPQNAGLTYAPPTSVVWQNSGYNATAEGSELTSRYVAGPQLISPTSQSVFQFPLSREAEVSPGAYVRIRATASTTINAYAYLIFAE